MQRVLRDTLVIEPGTVQATVDDGVVTLTGRTARRTTAITAVPLTAAVAGVTAVIDRLSFDTDDTITAAAPQPSLGRPGRASGAGSYAEPPRSQRFPQTALSR
jgi:BON domain-containing protein